MSVAVPTFWLIAGPNGVGKTTFALKRLEAVSGSINFVNFDEISRGLSPLRPAAAEIEAARIALARVEHFIAGRSTFSLETTLSGKTHLRLVRRAQSAGMTTSLLYFSAATPEICLDRIARRVAEGGHDVAPKLVRRRFLRSLENLPGYLREIDLWRVYDASGPTPILAMEGRRSAITVSDEAQLRKSHPALSELPAALLRP